MSRARRASYTRAMAVLIGILIALGALVVLVILAGFLSPRKAFVQRSLEIDASPDRVFPYLNNLRNFVDHWSPWTEKDPQAKHEYNEIAEGAGARYAWTGHPKKVGTGSMEIRESEPGKRVKTFLQFKGRGEAFASWHVQDLGSGRTRVTWDFEADNGWNPVSRIFGLLMDRFLGPDYEKGLSKLKSVCERKS